MGEMFTNTKRCKRVKFLVWSVVGVVAIVTQIAPSSCSTSADQSDDVACLKSMKVWFEEPQKQKNGLTSSWNFMDNKTKDFMCNFVGVECNWTLGVRVLNISLPNMGLRGHFTQGIFNCFNTTTRVLNLSGNQLSGTIPQDISQRLPFVSVLDLSRNHLSGRIPAAIANCSHLNVLMLHNNKLTGKIPLTLGRLLPRLSSFSVANNLLRGAVPATTPGVPWGVDSYSNNSGLCGGPLDPCLDTSTPGNRDTNFDPFTFGFLLGYLVSLALVLLLVFSFCDCKPELLAKKKRSEKRRRPASAPPDLMLSSLERLVTRMSFEGLREATSDFCKDNVIGFGRTGTMYKATLSNGWHLTVKRLYHAHHFKRQFVSELMTLGRFRHNNLVPLLGFCIYAQERLLVYKYMSNQSLYHWLHDHKHTDFKIIAWPLKVKIILGLARGLAWLHHRCSLRVAHLNLSSKCILLDKKFEPKISNFGEALILNPKDIQFQSSRDFVITQELWEVGFLRKDVYDFGVVILELITGMDPSDVAKNLDKISLAVTEWTTNGCCISVGSSGFFVDTVGIGQGYDEEIFMVLGVARNCVEPPAELRPSMLQVYKGLRNLGERHGLQEDYDC